MKRNLSDLQQSEFDILIIGGGITGACLALDAVLRGLSVALVEKGDFGAATSSASSKLLHGGIRYLQQLNLAKVRESAYERVYFQRLAPHLTHYIPFIIPTYPSFSKGKLVLKSAMMLYEGLCAGQNRLVQDPAKKVPRGRFASRQEINELIPGLNADDITGGIIFYESHMHSSERMTLGFLDTAVRHGAVVANYLEAERFLTRDRGSVYGVRAKDGLSGVGIDIRASLVINAAGPWIPMLNRAVGREHRVEGIVNAFSKGAHIVTTSLTQGHAVALPTRKQTQAVLNRGGRHVFILPWRGYSLIGTTYGPYAGDIDKVRATEEDVQEMMMDINSALGNEVLRREDVVHAYAGLYPLIDDFINPKVYQGTGKYQIIDHSAKDGLDGLVSVFGAKFTTARLLAEKAIDTVAGRFDKVLGHCKTREIRLAGGDIDDIQSYRKEKAAQYHSLLTEPVIDHLVTNYGADIDRVVKSVVSNEGLGEVLANGRHVLAAEAVYSAREEMACHLDDFVFRRTGLGTLGNPGVEVLRRCADLMGNEIGWNAKTKEKEVARTLKGFIPEVSQG